MGERREEVTADRVRGYRQPWNFILMQQFKRNQQANSFILQIFHW